MFRITAPLIAAAVVSLAPVAAQANLTIPTNFLVATSVQAFPLENREAFELVGLSVAARGTAFVVEAADPAAPSTPGAFGFPITKIVIGSKLNIVSGTAAGSALYFNRNVDADFDGIFEKTVGLTLANFTIDYNRKKVLADTTPAGGKTSYQTAIYDFTVQTPLALKYKFPLNITLHEVLGNLMLTPETKDIFRSALELDELAEGALELPYGTLTQDVTSKLRPKAISTKPYVAK